MSDTTGQSTLAVEVIGPQGVVAQSTPGEFVSVAAGQVLALVATAIAAKILTVELGGEEYGRLTLGLTLTALCGQSIYGPLNSALARLWPAYREAGRAPDLLAATDGVVIAITLSLGLIGFVAAAGLYMLGNVNLALLTAGSFGFALFQNVFAVYNSLETANRRRIWAAVFQSLVPVSRVGFGGGAVLLLGGSAVAAALGLTVGVVAVLVAQHRVFIASLARSGAPKNWISARRELWTYGRYFLGWGALGGLQLVSDVWALKLFTDDYSVGIYALASLVAASSVASAGAVVTQFVYPIAFQRAGSARSSARVRGAVLIIRRAAAVMCLLTILALAGAVLIGPELVVALSTPTFSAAGLLLPPIVLVAGVQQVANLLGLVPMVVADMRRYLMLRMGTTLLAISLNLVGAWLFGITGLIEALITSSLVYLLGVLWLQRSALDVASANEARHGGIGPT